MICGWWDFLWSLIGSTPTTTRLDLGYLFKMKLTVSRTVSAISMELLVLPERLLVPPTYTMLFGDKGIDPCLILQRMCSHLSPPIPILRYLLNWFWNRELNRGRNSRSKWESPMRQFCVMSRLQAFIWSWCFPSHLLLGFDRFVWYRLRGTGVRAMIGDTECN